jgi:hypothetical protein
MSCTMLNVVNLSSELWHEGRVPWRLAMLRRWAHGKQTSLHWIGLKWWGEHCYIETMTSWQPPWLHNRVNTPIMSNHRNLPYALRDQHTGVASCCWGWPWWDCTREGLETALDSWFLAEDLCVVQWYAHHCMCISVRIMYIYIYELSTA